MASVESGSKRVAPLVSVVIPCYNRSDLVIRALRSVERQTYRPLEVIIVDDASDTPLSCPVDSVASLDVQVVRRDTRGGPGVARNTAAPYVRGEFVAFLDSDDEWVATKIERQVQRLRSLERHLQPRMLICGFSRSTGTRSWVVTPPNGRVYTQTSLLAGSAVPLTASVMMIDAEPFRSGQIRFDERLPNLEDLDLAIQVAGAGTVVCQDDLLTLKYRDHDRDHAYTHSADVESRRTLAAKYDYILDSNIRARVGFDTRRVVGLIGAGMIEEAAAVAMAASRERGPLSRLSSRTAAVTIRTPARPLVRVVGRGLLRAQRVADRGEATVPSGGAARVAFVLPNLEVGGVQRAHLLIGRYLSDNVEPLFVALHAKDNDDRPSLQSRFEAAGHQVCDLGVRGRADRSPLALLAGAWRLRRLCRAQKIDIVDSCIVEADLVARLATIGMRTLHVTHLVNTTYDAAVERQLGGRSRLRFATLRTIDAFSARRTDAFVALTDSVADSARRHLHIETRKLSVIPRGVDLTEFSSAPVSGGGQTSLRVLSVGRVAPSKGHEFIVQAIALLQEWGIDAEVVIAGDGPLLGEVRRLADELGVTQRVSLLGAVDFERVRALLAEADVFCFPSKWEGQGNALLEAMASARPIVASDIATIHEVLGDAGVLVTPEDPLALAVGLRRVAEMSLDERKTLGDRARSRVEHRFGAAARVRDLEEFYMGMIDGESGRSDLATVIS
jgi:glycosyltransferase involved in cell wall biosynthesis